MPCSVFEEVNGVYAEVVYDNMRNVVSRFIGGNEKELNTELIQLATYYGFNVNVTNCFSGNEKGTVESRVKHIRQSCFTKQYQFNSLEAAHEHLTRSLTVFNKASQIEEENIHLLTYRPPYELADYHEAKVPKYSTIHYQNNQYSVPDYLVGDRVQIKVYAEYLVIYANEQEVARHNKIEGSNEFQLDISHYIKTLKKKPGALRHSLVLKQNPELETLYYNYYSENPSGFIELLEKYKEFELNELIQYIELEQSIQRVHQTQSGTSNKNEVLTFTEATLRQLTSIYGLEEAHVNDI